MTKSNFQRPSYPSDITQAQWDAIDQLLPVEAERGRIRQNSLRDIVDAINYRWTTGCSWRMLPHDFPNWQTVYSYFRAWQAEGLLGEMRKILISRKMRKRSANRAPEMPQKSSPNPLPTPQRAFHRGIDSCHERLTTSQWPTGTS